MSRLIKKVSHMLLFTISVLSIIILILVIVLQIYSTGKPKPFVDKFGEPIKGSISEKTFVTIGGIRQGMIIQSKNIHNPVLLYLHGGIPDYFLTKIYPTGLEDYFTVVWWDQRGAGLSFNPNIPEESMTLDQMISDTREVTNYLRKRFGQDKIYLMGRSGGTFIGVHVAAKSPELYHAYIGIAQMSDHLKSERLAYEYMLKEFRKAGNKKMVKKLEGSPVTNVVPLGYLKLRDEAMHTIGVGTTRKMNSIISGIFSPSLTCRDYTIAEKVNLWRAKAKSGVHPLWDTILATDLSKQIHEFKIPVYFIHGIFDYTVSYNLAKEYFNKIKAPIKGFYTFEKSAHSPMFEEPEKMQLILLEDVLKGTNSLTDKK
ncbi:MAG: alpha/beta hydrolase [Bacteroidetes bacterium HGW-Bacteroidetes-19]|nr:MAG: alpha/beta hydrolase [Bacteroidetes bacterium HGW-Bacteroidetes-20]PKP28510.1 MAG: alpha/beta hydrolase [Bacteroidetes bacterium HGW-Bacteroidetes-19]